MLAYTRRCCIRDTVEIRGGSVYHPLPSHIRLPPTLHSRRSPVSRCTHPLPSHFPVSVPCSPRPPNPRRPRPPSRPDCVPGLTRLRTSSAGPERALGNLASLLNCLRPRGRHLLDAFAVVALGPPAILRPPPHFARAGGLLFGRHATDHVLRRTGKTAFQPYQTAQLSGKTREAILRRLRRPRAPPTSPRHATDTIRPQCRFPAAR